MHVRSLNGHPRPRIYLQGSAVVRMPSGATVLVDEVAVGSDDEAAAVEAADALLGWAPGGSALEARVGDMAHAAAIELARRIPGAEVVTSAPTGPWPNRRDVIIDPR